MHKFVSIVFKGVNIIVDTHLFILSCLLVLFSISCFSSIVHVTEVNFDLLRFLGACLLTMFFVIPFHAGNINCVSLLTALLTSQLVGIIGVYYFPNYDPLWIITFLGMMLNFNVYLTLTVPSIFHIMRSWINLGLFKTHLSAGTALVGSLAQTVIATYYIQDHPYLIGLAFFSSFLIALNIQPYLEKSVLLGSSVFHNYYYLFLNSIKGARCARSLFLRCSLIIFALIRFNPLMALAASFDF